MGSVLVGLGRQAGEQVGLCLGEWVFGQAGGQVGMCLGEWVFGQAGRLAVYWWVGVWACVCDQGWDGG